MFPHYRVLSQEECRQLQSELLWYQIGELWHMNFACFLTLTECNR